VRISRLTLADLRRFGGPERGSASFELAPGVTVVRGPNEAGKTTLQRAIELALTRKVTSSWAELEHLRPWDEPEGAQIAPSIEIDFVVEDEDRTRNGHLKKTFAGQKGTVSLELDGETVTDPTRAEELIADITGIPSEGFFRSTASIHHHEMAVLDSDEAALRDRLQTTISGADRGTSRARKTLERVLRDTNARGEKNPGRLKVAEDAASLARDEVDRGEAALAQLETDRAALVDAREARAAADATLAERRAMLEKARQAERTTAERDAAQEKFERYREAVGISHELAALRDSHPAKQPLPALKLAVEKLRATDGRIREIRAILGEEEEVVADEIPPEPAWRRGSRLAIGLVIAGVAVAAVLIVANRAFSIGIQSAVVALPGLILVGLGVIAALAGWYLRRLDRQRLGLVRVDVARRLRGRSDLQETLKIAEAEMERQLEAVGQGSLAEAEALLEAESAHVERENVLTAQYEGLVGRQPADALPQLRDAAALEIEQKTAALEALGPIAKEPRARERLEAEVAEQEQAVERARDAEANARARVEQNAVDADEVAAAVERSATADERLADVQRRARIVETTLRAIESAEQATMKTATRYLERHMTDELAAVTDGRYRRVRVDDKTLDIEIWSPERGDWVDVHQLSTGTIDLVYLAARIGLVRLVTGDRRPPLVCDDPFVTFDDVRARRAFERLRALAGDLQVLFLTTSERYDALADAVIVLDAPTAVDAAAPAAG
jgi:DNA repair exonuclease SbcCD ATPase subunit